MRIALFSILSLAILMACKSTKTGEKIDPNAPQVDSIVTYPAYPFKDSFIDLETLKSSKFITSRNYNFKLSSKYKNRFTNEIWFKLPKDSILKDKYCTYEFTNPSIIKITNPDYEVSYVDLPIEYFVNEIEQMPYTIPYEEGIVLVYDVPDSLCYNIYKINWTGKVIHSARIEHTKVTHPKKNENHYDFYLYPIAFSNQQLIFSSNWSSYSRQKTVIVDMDFFTVHEYDKKVNGLVWDENEEKVMGFIYPKEDTLAKEPRDISFYFDIQKNEGRRLSITYFQEASSTLLIDDILVIANYHPIATGASLQAFDINTGYKIWEADVKQLMADHSKYHNKVILSAYKDKIIMEGNEAYGSYLQIFDLKTGKRLKQFGLLEIKD